MWNYLFGSEEKTLLSLTDADKNLDGAYRQVVGTINETNAGVRNLLAAIVQRQSQPGTDIEVKMLKATVVIRHRHMEKLVRMATKLLEFQQNVQLAMCQDRAINAISDGARSLDKYRSFTKIENVEKFARNAEEAIAHMDEIDATIEETPTSNTETSTSSSSLVDSEQVDAEYQKIFESFSTTSPVTPAVVAVAVADEFPKIPTTSEKPAVSVSSSSSSSTGKIVQTESATSLRVLARDAPYFLPTSSVTTSTHQPLEGNK